MSIRNYLYGVKLLHLFSDAPFPSLSTFEFRFLFKGLKVTLAHTPRQALPITPPILLAIHAQMDFSSPLHLTLWSAFVIAFFLFARKSNIVPASAAQFSPDKHLCRGDILVSHSGIVVHIKWSKTIQAKQRYLLVPIMALPLSPLCPLRAYLNMTSALPADPHSPAFLIPSGSSLTTLTHATFTSNLRHMLATLGYQPSAYSGHSFRRGGASWAFQAGVPGELIQAHGDWSSDCYLRYLDFPLQVRASVTQLMGSATAGSG